MASAIPSVTGPIAGPDLGQVLVHEHVVCGAAGVTRSAAALAGGFEALIERGVTALQAARAEGLTTMVDATPFDLGRDVELLAEVSRRSGVTILAATGHWLLPSVFMANRSVSELAEMFVADLTTGADGTSIRCGVMKVASEEEITAFDRRVLEAVAIAHRETGAPIITHAAARNRIGEAQAAVFDELGVPPDRVVIGHADDTLRARLPDRPGRPRLRHRHGPDPVREPPRVRRTDRRGPHRDDRRPRRSAGTATGSWSATTTRSGPGC